MNALLLWLDILFTLGIFCGVCWRAKETHNPPWRDVERVLEWVMWVGCHLLLALVMLGLLADRLDEREAPPIQFIAAKLALSTMFLFPWRRRKTDA